ncbi:hypothetical protein DXB95_07625 [Streptococcus ilei]|nr:hypothetical protein DXB95_07625 [Streptococcus ilei]
MFGPNPLFNFVLHNRLIKSTPHIRVRPSSIPHFKKKENEREHLKNKKESGTEIGNWLEFDFVVPSPHSFNSLGDC